MQDAQKIVGETIRRIRLRKGITQEELAELAGINRTHMYRIENGHVKTTVGSLQRIANALEIRVRDLVRDV